MVQEDSPCSSANTSNTKLLPTCGAKCLGRATTIFSIVSSSTCLKCQPSPPPNPQGRGLMREYVCASPVTPARNLCTTISSVLSGVLCLELIFEPFSLHCLLKRLPRAFFTCHFERLQGMLV